MEQYTKGQSLGYVIMSLKDLGYSKEDIKKIINKIDDNMTDYTEVWADKAYDDKGW